MDIYIPAERLIKITVHHFPFSLYFITVSQLVTSFFLPVTLGGLVVVCLPLDPRLVGSNLAEDIGFLRAINICNMISFGGEVKLLVLCHKILWHVRESHKYE
jgi:hypothetical protein